MLANDCEYSIYGCCPDGKTLPNGPNYENCPSDVKLDDVSKSFDFMSNESLEPLACDKTEFGCCDDGFTPAKNSAKENCPDYVIDLNEPVNKNGQEKV